MIVENKKIKFQYLDGIKGLLLTLNKAHQCDKSEQIESVAKSSNSNYTVFITYDVHTHEPAPANVQWFTIELHSGDDTPETIHIYVDPIDSTYLAVDTNGVQVQGFNKPGGKAISVENKLRPDIDWY